MQRESVKNIFHSEIVEDRAFERRNWVDVTASNFILDTEQQPSEIIFSTQQLKENYLLPADAYIRFKLHFYKVHDAATTPIVAGDLAQLRNGSMSIFDNIEIQVGDQDNKIEELRCTEHWGNIEHIMYHSKSEDLAHQGYELPKSNAVTRSSLLHNNEMFVYVYLRNIPFFRHWDGLLTKTKFRLCMRPNYNKIVSNNDSTSFKISRAELFIPEVILLPEYRAKVLQKFNNGASKRLLWQSVDTYQSQLFSNNTTNVHWNISSEIKKPSWVYFVLSSGENIGKGSQILYNTWDIQSYAVSVNNKEVFFENSISFVGKNAMKLYENLRRKQQQTFSEASIISYIEFCSMYRILCFNLEDCDAASVYNSRGDSSVSLSLRMTISAVNKPLTIHCFVEREKEISINYKSDRVELGFAQL